MDYEDDIREIGVEEKFSIEAKIRAFIYSWCKDVGVTTPVGWKRNWRAKEIVLYTDRPGLLIGRYGGILNAYTDDLHKEFSSLKDYKFRFEEVDIFSNYAPM